VSKWRDSHDSLPFGMFGFEKSLQEVWDKKSKMLKNHDAILSMIQSYVIKWIATR